MSEEVKLLNRFERIDRFSPSQVNRTTQKDAVSAENPTALQVLQNVAWCANADVRTLNLKSIIQAFTALK